jgi:hypothetical protein
MKHDRHNADSFLLDFFQHFFAEMEAGSSGNPPPRCLA